MSDGELEAAEKHVSEAVDGVRKVLEYIAVLYMLEANLKERKATHDEIRAERQEKAVPILAVIRKLMEKYKTMVSTNRPVDTPQSALTQACRSNLFACKARTTPSRGGTGCAATARRDITT